MLATNQRAWQVRLALMLILGVAAAAAGVLTLLWWKTPAASAQEETTGEASFVVSCKFSHRAKNDPIVYFKQPGASHSHDFFGNTTTDAYSTWDSLRAGGTTCTRSKDTAAYWIPTVSWVDSKGSHILDNGKGLFYYRLANKDPNEDVEPHPAGLKVVTQNPARKSYVNWRCANGTWSSTPPTKCSNGILLVRIEFPDCLAQADPNDPNQVIDPGSGQVVDSSDHRSHMAYALPQSDGKRHCPSTHPIPVPQLRTNIQFGTADNPVATTRGTVELSSGDWSTMHADFFNAWEQTRFAELVDHCINAGPFTASNPKPQECG